MKALGTFRGGSVVGKRSIRSSVYRRPLEKSLSIENLYKVFYIRPTSIYRWPLEVHMYTEEY